jgi:hypothetical protein
MTKRNEGEDQLSILELLPQNRRQEIIAEALQGQVAELLASNPDATLGDFVATLEQHQYWAGLKELRVSQVLSPRMPDAPAARRVEEGRLRARRLTGDVVDRVLAYIERNPSQRSEQIQGGLRNEDPSEVQRALAKLRKDKRVKLEGQRRSMTYSV